jgi:hypothetical protein
MRRFKVAGTGFDSCNSDRKNSGGNKTLEEIKRDASCNKKLRMKEEVKGSK